jgi:hypothetical protein
VPTHSARSSHGEQPLLPKVAVVFLASSTCLCDLLLEPLLDPAQQAAEHLTGAVLPQPLRHLRSEPDCRVFSDWQGDAREMNPPPPTHGEKRSQMLAVLPQPASVHEVTTARRYYVEDDVHDRLRASTLVPMRVSPVSEGIVVGAVLLVPTLALRSAGLLISPTGEPAGCFLQWLFLRASVTCPSQVATAATVR